MASRSINRTRKLIWHLVATVFVAGLAMFHVADVQAASRVCRQLEAQLAAAGAGTSGQAARYDAAIAKQQEQMRKARQQARQAGCGRSVFGASVAACANLNAVLDKMQRNLLDLQGKRARMSGGGGKRERARILAALDLNGCRAQIRKQPAPEESRQRTVIEPGTHQRIGGLSGSFRTLCVRTCDGYFFPISYGVSSAAFERDQNACAAMCPGTQVELHYHKVPDEESSDMISVNTGLPYSQMQNAWRYRESDADTAPSCGCGASAAPAERGFEVIGGSYATDGPDQAASPEVAEPPLPKDRPDPAEDPETLANRDGGLDLKTMTRLAVPPSQSAAEADRPAAVSDRPVRVVGPVFLPDPEEAIDLQAPARPAAR